MTYEKLAYDIQQKNVDIIEMNFKQKSKKGLYMDSTIAISKGISNDTERRCILAEEIGHHYTSYGNILDNGDTNCIKQEKRARNWAYEKLVGIVDLINAYNKGVTEKYNLAEHLNVTEDFLEEAIKHYKEKYGVYCEIDNYIVYFEPCLGVIKIF